jgi:hypothetical protein
MSSDRVYTVFAVAFFYLILEYIQVKFLFFIYINKNTAIFYAPAAVSIFSILIAPYYSSFGILIGGLCAIYFADQNMDLIALTTKAGFPALGCVATAFIVTRCNSKLSTITKPKSNLAELDAFDVLLVCIVYAATTNIFTGVYFSEILNQPQINWVFMVRVFGNIVGAFLIFIAINIGYSAYRILTGQIEKF